MIAILHLLPIHLWKSIHSTSLSLLFQDTKVDSLTTSVIQILHELLNFPHLSEAKASVERSER